MNLMSGHTHSKSSANRRLHHLIFAASKIFPHMKKEITSWYSPSLNKEMPIAAYGDYGFALLLVPTAAADFLEYERFQLMDYLAPFIDGGKVKVFSIDSINNESWLNSHM